MSAFRRSIQMGRGLSLRVGRSGATLLGAMVRVSLRIGPHGFRLTVGRGPYGRRKPQQSLRRIGVARDNPGPASLPQWLGLPSLPKTLGGMMVVVGALLWIAGRKAPKEARARHSKDSPASQSKKAA